MGHGPVFDYKNVVCINSTTVDCYFVDHADGVTPVLLDTAGAPSEYTIDGGHTISAVALGATNDIVRCTISTPLSTSTLYNVTIDGDGTTIGPRKSGWGYGGDGSTIPGTHSFTTPSSFSSLVTMNDTMHGHASVAWGLTVFHVSVDGCGVDTLLGWGSGPWGSAPWGGAELVDPCLFMQRADAVRENVIRITFAKPIYFTNYSDVPDGASIAKYLVTKIAGTIGLDGAPVRDVSPIEILLSDVEGNDGTMVDVILDRPMTPFPAVYHIEVFGIFNINASGSIDPERAALDVFAVYREIEQPSVETLVPSRDFANPSTFSGALDPLPDPGSDANLGTIPVDDSGDYAFDEGVQSFKKRIFRRLTTRLNGFAHLPGYGVGLLELGKKLSIASVREQKSADAEKQIAQEPETEAVRVAIVDVPGHPEMFRLAVVVKMRGLPKATKFEMDIPAT